MSPPDKIDIDFATENKLLKAEVKGKISDENESLVLRTRQSKLYALCGNDMAIFTSVVDILGERGLIDEDICQEARARTRQRAEANPLRPQPEKIENLRVELRRDPSPVLAALLEEHAFSCTSKEGYTPLVYYGEGVLAKFKKHVFSPDVVSVCPIAQGGVVGRLLGAGRIGVQDPPYAPVPVAPIIRPQAELRQTVSTFRIDKALLKPEFKDTIADHVTRIGPVTLKALTAHLMEGTSRTRLLTKTEERFKLLLDGLVADQRLHLDETGSYRSSTLSKAPTQSDVGSTSGRSGGGGQASETTDRISQQSTEVTPDEDRSQQPVLPVHDSVAETDTPPPAREIPIGRGTLSAADQANP